MWALPTIGWGQSLFQTVRPDALVLVKKHPSGADIVEISMTAPGFPPEVLQERATAICTELGYGPHGLSVYTDQIGNESRSMQFLKARFGTNGLIDSQSGVLRLQPIVRAFAGIAAPHTVKGLAITFDGVRPTSQTLQKFKSKSVSLEAQYNPPPASGLEYRIDITGQDASQITIPERAEPIAQKAPSESKTETQPTPTWITGLLLAVTALSFGALVYFGFLRFNARRR